MNGPFFNERGTNKSPINSCYLRLAFRRRTIILSVLLLVRVLYPFDGTPQGETGCRPPDVLPLLHRVDDPQDSSRRLGP